MKKMIYSESEGRMVAYGFVRKYSASDSVVIGKEHFTWHDDDEVYYSDDVDGSYYEEYETEEPYTYYSNGSWKRIDFVWDEVKTA